MKSVATMKIKIPTEPVLLKTMEQYSKSAQIVADIGFGQHISNKRMLHDSTYQTIRSMLDLPAQLVCSSRDKACETLKSVFLKHGFQPSFKKYLSIRYDARSFSIKNNIVSLCTIKGRIKIPIIIPDCYKQYAKWEVDSADLIYDNKQRMFLHIVVSKDIDTDFFCGNRIVGVDVGVNPIAITSDKKFYHNTMMPVLKRYERLRKSLQAKGTKSAKRHLKKMSGREQRFKANVNHIVSKSIVEELKAGEVLSMEDLTNIRNGKAKWNKSVHKWNFRQLRDFCTYKANRKGNSVVLVNPAYTSTRCSKCHSMHTEHIRGWFHCFDCGFQLNSHLNASRNIRELGNAVVPLGRPVNLPIVASDEVKARPLVFGTETDQSYKPPNLFGGS
jgi:putative transposase